MTDSTRPRRTHEPPLAAVRTTASHTIAVGHLAELLAAVPADVPFDSYRHAAIVDNALGRPTYEGRRRVLRHLRELYLLDADRLEFSALRLVHADDPAALPLVAGMLALARDELFRASWPVVAGARVGAVVTSVDLAEAVAASGPGGLGASTLAKVGRNVAASWSQTGHLAGRQVKHRTRVEARPGAVAYALLLGHLAGLRGLPLLDSPWFALLDLADDERRSALDAAHRRGLIDVRSAGTVLEVDVRPLTGGSS